MTKLQYFPALRSFCNFTRIRSKLVRLKIQSLRKCLRSLSSTWSLAAVSLLWVHLRSVVSNYFYNLSFISKVFSRIDRFAFLLCVCFLLMFGFLIVNLRLVIASIMRIFLLCISVFFNDEKYLYFCPWYSGYCNWMIGIFTWNVELPHFVYLPWPGYLILIKWTNWFSSVEIK